MILLLLFGAISDKNPHTRALLPCSSFLFLPASFFHAMELSKTSIFSLQPVFNAVCDSMGRPKNPSFPLFHAIIH